MNDRVHACLDGEIPRAELTAEERVCLAALEAAIVEVAAPLRSAPVPNLTARVMRGLPEPSPQPSSGSELRETGRRFLAWLWRPRAVTLSFRPAYALGGMCAAVLLLVGLPTAPVSSVGSVAEVEVPADGDPRLYVQFRLEAPEASHVELAGTFTRWQPQYELRETAPGVWSALIPLEPGVHDYTFIIDGERWVADPYAPQVDDGFGGNNSRLFLASPVTGSA